MSDQLTIQEIKDDIRQRGWRLVHLRFPWGENEATIYDLTIETKENLYLAPYTVQSRETKDEAIMAVYERALVYLPSLPALYDEHGIEYEIVTVKDDD